MGHHKTVFPSAWYTKLADNFCKTIKDTKTTSVMTYNSTFHNNNNNNTIIYYKD